MRNDQILIGLVVAAGCCAGLWQAEWILGRTRWGALFQRLFRSQAGLALRIALCLGIAFGGLLAANLIRPVQW